jgi:hypothetical protein
VTGIVLADGKLAVIVPAKADNIVAMSAMTRKHWIRGKIMELGKIF